MRRVALIAVALAGCVEDEPPELERLGGFAPPPPGADQAQIVAPIVRGVAPGADVEVCSYLPLWLSPDGELDVIEVAAFQSAPGGHGAVLVVLDEPHRLTGDVCDDAERDAGQVVAPGTHLPAGAPLLVRSRWVNHGAAPLDGQAAFTLTVAVP